MALFEVNVGLNRQALHWINNQVVEGQLTDAIIAPLTTVAGLRAVTFTGFEVQRRFYEFYQKAIDRAQAIGVLTDALVAAADTVAGLQLLFTGGDSLLTAGEQYSLVG